MASKITPALRAQARVAAAVSVSFLWLACLGLAVYFLISGWSA